MIMDALRIVDGTAARIRRYAESTGMWDTMSAVVVSDHGHSRVTHHEDLAGIVAIGGASRSSASDGIRAGAGHRGDGEWQCDGASLRRRGVTIRTR